MPATRNNANILRGSVTIQPGTVSLNTIADTTVAFAGVEIGDKPIVNVVSGLSASLIAVPGPPASTVNVITVRIANIASTTVAGGTVICSVSIIKNQGPT